MPTVHRIYQQLHSTMKRIGVIVTIAIISLIAPATTIFAAPGDYTWTSHRMTMGGDSQSWQSISSSADGTKLAAVADGGSLYTSTDAGATWTE